MAEIVLGIGTSHSPMFALAAEDWAEYSARDVFSQELVFPPDGITLSYEAALDYVPDEIKKKPRDLAAFQAHAAACDGALDELAKTLADVNPDVTVIISDDQDEWFFESNMPALAIYWGETAQVIPGRGTFGGLRADLAQQINDNYGDKEVEVTVPSDLGRHAIEYLMDNDFDVTHLRYTEERYGGEVVRRYPTVDGEIDAKRTTAPRPMGLPHGFSFVVKRLFDNKPTPILPVIQNTCYPPNQVRPRRAYAFGQALSQAIRSWDSDARVAVVASGGLSHFVVDEEVDRTVLSALERKDADALRATPRNRLFSATSETLNWIAAGGVFADSPLNFETVAYAPVYRSEVGTGGGWAFGRWV